MMLKEAAVIPKRRKLVRWDTAGPNVAVKLVCEFMVLRTLAKQKTYARGTYFC